LKVRVLCKRAHGADARGRDVEQERKAMQRRLLDEQVHLKQQIAEEEKKQEKQVTCRNAGHGVYSCYNQAERSMLEHEDMCLSHVVGASH
jgi:hypothetical protein